MKHGLTKYLLWVIVVALTGCNGGGGGGSGSSSTSSASSSSSVSSQSSSSSSSSSSAPLLNTTISGTAFEFASGTITFYYVVAGQKVASSAIAGGKVNATGGFSQFIGVVPGQPLVVELTNGCYTDYGATTTGAVNGQQKCMSTGDVLRTVLVPVAGTNNVEINIFTEAATGYAHYLALHGQDDVSAVKNGVAAISTWLDFDIQGVTPVTIDDTATADPSHTYGLLLGGAVSYLYNVSKVDQAVYGFEPYDSVYFAQMMSNDLAFDGVLNGIGDDGTGKQKVLLLGSQGMNASTYRHDISAYAAIENRVLIPFNVYTTFVPLLVGVNNSVAPIFGSTAVTPLDEGGATFLNNILAQFPTGSVSYHLSTYFTDIVGVSAIEVLVDGVHYTTMLYDWRYYGQATADVNTTIFKNGTHTITIRIVNLLGTTSDQTGTVLFTNDCNVYPTACL